MFILCFIKKFLESNGYSLGKASRQKLLTSPLLKTASIQSLPKDDTDLKDMVKSVIRNIYLFLKLKKI